MVNAVETEQDALARQETSPFRNRALLEPTAVSKRNSQHIRVLIIDGHEAVRRALRIRLSVTHHLEIVGVCQDPQDAVELILNKRPDVVLLGLHRSSDRELALMARSVHEMSSGGTRVIALAPYADAVERELLLNAGAKRYLLKHINSDRLIGEIESVVAGTAVD
jgi:DNA-binding NarL/FixJ family response regulator